jgi:YD repeat-containing protein
VRTCVLQRTCYVRKCGSDACETQEWGDSTTLEFRLDGTMARHSHRNHDRSQWTTTYEYDSAGKLLTTHHQNGVELIGVTVHEYDAASRLARVSYRPQGGDARTVESYEYLATGCKIKTHYTDPASRPPVTAWGIEGTDAAYSARGAVTLTTQYNERDQPGKVLFLDAAGRELSRVELRYDERGNMVEEAQTHSDETLPAEMLASLNEAQRETVRSLFWGGGKFVQRTHR